MGGQNIKKNFLYSTTLTVSGFVFTFLTFPYISRVLGVNNIGICNFVDSVINYFILVSMLGVNAIGIREIAKYKNDKNALEESFRDIFFLNGLFTLAGLIILIVLIFVIPKFYQYKELMFIGAAKLFFNFLLVEWFYKGTENFKYITVRTLTIKIVYVVSVFIFVREQKDYIIYYFLTSMAVIVNAIYNWRYLCKQIQIKISGLRLKRFLPGIVTMGIYMILTSLYTTFNVVYLGFVAGEKEVGYYTTATKLYTILLAVFTAFTGVMLPRMTSLVAEGRMEEFRDKIIKSFKFLFNFSFPIVVFAEIFAPQIVLLIAGPGYSGAVMPMRVVMPLLIVIGMEQILILQVLLPLGKDKFVLWNSIIGAFFGLALNILIVREMKSVGSAIVWICCELLVLIGAQVITSKFVKINFPFRLLFKQIFYIIPIVVLVIGYQYYFSTILSYWFVLLIGFIIVVTYYLMVNLFFIKDPMFVKVYENYKKKIFKF